MIITAKMDKGWYHNALKFAKIGEIFPINLSFDT